MPQWRNLIAIARRRLWRTRVLDALPIPMLAAAVAALVAFLLGKALPGAMPPWWVTCLALAGAALLAVLVVTLRRSPSDLSAALEVDRVLGLRDRVSIALESEGRDDSFARAAVADAVRATADPSHRVRLRRGMPATAPRGWWWVLPVVAVTAVVEWLLPSWTAREAVADEATEIARGSASEAIESLEQAIAEKPELETRLAEMGEESPTNEELFAELEDPEEIRLEAIRQVTALEQKLEQILESPEAMASAELSERLGELEVPREGASRDLALEMRLGNFAAASEEIEELRERLERGEMTDAEREALAAELEALADQLARLAGSNQSLDEQLRAAGVDPALAGELTPEDLARLQEALERMPSLSEEERKALMEAAQAAQQSSGQCRQMSESMQQMASQCRGGQSSPQSMGREAQQSLDQAEQMAALLRQARAAQSQCQGRARGLGGQGFLRPGGGEQPGPGMGGRGRGAGGVAPRTETETATEVVREGGALRRGDVIARSLIEGEVTVGEAQVPLERIERAAQGSSPADAGAEDPVPPHLRDAHRHYFGELRRLVRPSGAPGGSASSPKPATADAPRDAPKDSRKDSPKGTGS